MEITFKQSGAFVVAETVIDGEIKRSGGRTEEKARANLISLVETGAKALRMSTTGSMFVHHYDAWLAAAR